MDIKKALLFIEAHCLPKDQEVVKEITRELSDHLNSLVNEFEVKDAKITRQQAEIDRLENAIKHISSLIELRRTSRTGIFVADVQHWKDELEKAIKDNQ